MAVEVARNDEGIVYREATGESMGASNERDESSVGEFRAVVLADCEPDELKEFVAGLNRSTGLEWSVRSHIANWPRTSKIAEFRRYLAYFMEPFRFFLERDKYDAIIGWQQFYAIGYAFYCNLFKVEKRSFVCAGNYTYKAKKGLIGKVYHWYMSFVARSRYMDRMHIPSREYASICADDLGVSPSKFLFAPFGIDDVWGEYGDLVEDGGYALAIGRSNRDYDWLIEEWTADFPLVIISDTYISKSKLPDNVTLISDVSGDAQYPYIARCRCLIIPIDDSDICSGDTVLLTGMSLGKRTIVTAPSALAGTYIEDGVNGYLCSKEPGCLAEVLDRVVGDLDVDDSLIRKSFLDGFSRASLGERLGKLLLPELESMAHE